MKYCFYNNILVETECVIFIETSPNSVDIVEEAFCERPRRIIDSRTWITSNFYYQKVKNLNL